MNSKGVFRAVLLLFVTYSLVVLAAKHATRGSDAAASPQSTAESSADSAASGSPRLAAHQIVIYYFHGKERCENCRNLETWAKEAVGATYADAFKAGQMEWRVVDFSQPENLHYDQEYKLGGVSCVAVSEMHDGTAGRWKVLDEGLMLAVTSGKPQVIEYVIREISAFVEK